MQKTEGRGPRWMSQTWPVPGTGAVLPCGAERQGQRLEAHCPLTLPRPQVRAGLTLLSAASDSNVAESRRACLALAGGVRRHLARAGPRWPGGGAGSIADPRSRAKLRGGHPTGQVGL